MTRYSYLAEMPYLLFDWIEENVIAASTSPYIQSHFDALMQSGIKVIVDLRMENEYDIDEETRSKFQIYHIPIIDGDTPTREQVAEFWRIYGIHSKKNEPIVVHCIAGCGRTGTMLALWLRLTGKYADPKQAIIELRRIRYCSVENTTQEFFVNGFTDSDLDMVKAVVDKVAYDTI